MAWQLGHESLCPAQGFIFSKVLLTAEFSLKINSPIVKVEDHQQSTVRGFVILQVDHRKALLVSS